MKRFLAGCLILAALTGLFYLYRQPPRTDSQTPLALLTEDGVVTVTMAQWLPLAVAAEMPAVFHPEALRAQAVAARTFALACRKHEADGANVCTDPGCCVACLSEADLRQRWGSQYESYTAKVRDAASATDGQYLTYRGAPIQAAFHASSLGYTEDSGALWSPLPYLISVSTPEQPEDVPGLVTEVTLTAQQLAQALELSSGREPASWVESLEPDGAGRVQTMTVCGQSFTGSQVRWALGLRSTAFTVRFEDDGLFRFTVSGYGHGVGMSQYGAQTYAVQGMGYRDILAHYYPGTRLTVHTG